MAFTISEALTKECLKNARVIAGEQGLNREIRLVNVMEVPDIVDWVSEDELLLTTGYPFKDSSASFVDLIQKLSSKKLAGLAVKTRRFLDGLPEEAINMANELNFPIIELPPEAHFDKIIRDLLSEVINRDYLIIKRTEQIHQTFTRLVLSGGEFQEVAIALANLCYARVQIINVFDEVLAKAEPQKETNKNLAIILGNRGETGDELIQRPVLLNNEVAANITMNILGRSVESEDIVAIERAATIVALVLLKKQAAAEVEKKYRDDFLNDLVDGEIESKETVIQRGAFFNMNLTLSYILFLIDVDSFEDIFLRNLKKDEKMSHNLLSSLFNFVFKTFFSKAGECIVWDRSDSIIVLYPFPNRNLDQDVKKFSYSIARYIKKAIDENIKDFTVTIGIGSFRPDIMDIKNSYQEALTAIKVGKSVWGNNGIYHYDDLGVYRILAQFHDKEELKSFVYKTVGNLLDYDKKKNTRLLSTLEQLLANNNNQKLTAEKMFIHPKTLAYRLQKIEEILGVSLNNAECRFSLYMALKILAMVDL